MSVEGGKKTRFALFEFDN